MFAGIHLHLAVYVFDRVGVLGVRAATAAELGGTATLALDGFGPDSASQVSGVYK